MLMPHNDHLREVVSNLIENAVKYTKKGNVTVDIVGDTSHATVSVHDTGIGIPKEDQVHLFQNSIVSTIPTHETSAALTGTVLMS